MKDWKGRIKTLVAKNKQLQEKVEDFRTQKERLSVEVDKLQSQLIAEQSKTWVDRLLKRGE